MYLDAGRYAWYRKPGPEYLLAYPENSKGLVVVVNKWDLVEDKTVKVMKTFENAIRTRFAPFVDFR